MFLALLLAVVIIIGIVYISTSKRIRWTQDLKLSGPGSIGHTIIATWWPGKYYLVMTIELDLNSPLARLTRSIKDSPSKVIPYNEVEKVSNTFVTQIFKCDKSGWVKEHNPNSPLYEREYSEISQARLGHKETIDSWFKAS
jgi:hypothetical protein